MKPKKKQGRKRKIFISVMLIFRLLFGGTQAASASSNSKKVQDEVGSKAGISRTLSRESSMIANLNQDDCPQSELVPEGAQRIIRTPSGYIISSIPRGGENDLPGKPSKFGPGSKAKGAAKRDFARRQAGKNPTSRQSGGGFFADAFPVRPRYPGRPGGLEPFGRVPPKLGPNPGNPVGGNGPRSSTTLSSKRSQSEYQPDGYSEEQIQMYKKNPKYSELAKDPQLILMGQERSINPKSEEEACTILQADNEGLVSGAKRTDLKAGDPNYDYKTDAPSKYTEIKVPRDGSLKDAAGLGRKSGLQQGNDGDVTLLVNLMRLRPEERAAYAKTFLEAAGGEGVIFINN
jgi:hypothetical protein